MTISHQKQTVTSNLGGQRGRGHPKLRWIDGVEEDVRRLGCRNWKTAAQDRNGWQKIVKEAKVHDGL
jgi:hypothetical protein